MSSCNVTPDTVCRLCNSFPSKLFYQQDSSAYFQCETCGLVFLDAAAFLDPQSEKARYETHENCPSDTGYRDFLNRLMQPLLAKLSMGGYGLDYGSGPGPTLSVMFEERGFRMNTYDPFFVSSPNALKRKYDFVTCTEAVEHFHQPILEFSRINTLLNPGGWLGVMTEELDYQNFGNWYYRKDPTHVSFYSFKTFEWLARKYDWRMENPRKNVFLFKKT